MSDTTRPFGGGSKLQVYDTSAYRDIAGIVSIGGFTVQNSEVETTELDPYAGPTTTPAVYNFIKTFISGWNDIGELSLECNLTQVEYAALLAWQLAGTKLKWMVKLRNGYAAGLKGFVKSLPMNIPQDKVVQMPFAIKLTDVVLFDTWANVVTNL